MPSISEGGKHIRKWANSESRSSQKGDIEKEKKMKEEEERGRRKRNQKEKLNNKNARKKDP